MPSSPFDRVVFPAARAAGRRFRDPVPATPNPRRCGAARALRGDNTILNVRTAAEERNTISRIAVETHAEKRQSRRSGEIGCSHRSRREITLPCRRRRRRAAGGN